MVVTDMVTWVVPPGSEPVGEPLDTTGPPADGDDGGGGEEVTVPPPVLVPPPRALERAVERGY